MNVKSILYTFLLLVTASSCGSNSTSQEQQQSVQMQSADASVHRTDAYDYSDSVMMGSHKIVYSLHREADDSLKSVVDENGETYIDNYYDLKVTKDGAQLFAHRFTKVSFQSYLDKGFVKNGILDGFRFISAHEGMVTFGACISYPESDMSAPFIITIGPDGSHTIQPDNLMDVEEETDTASI